MNELIAQARTFFESLTGGQRAALIAAIAVSVFAVVGVVWWSSAESYDAVLYGDSAELRKAAQKLEEAGIPYRYNSSGSGIEVPTASRGEAMVTAASAGLTGWQDILDTIDMGTSPSIEREYRTRALEFELQKTLNSLDSIEASRVHIVPLDRITFIGREKQASASVKIDTASPGALDRAQVKGIAQLVAGAVHGLNVGDVSIIDTDGSLLHPESDAVGSFGGVNLEELRAIRESAFQRNLQEAAARILGTRDAIFSTVSVELSTSAIERHSDTYNPDGAVVGSENIREESSKDQGRPAGVPGVETNLPENAPGGGGGAETDIFENTINYINSLVKETEIIAPGTVTRVSTSVAVDSSAIQGLISDGMTEDQIKEGLQKVIRTAVGFDETRNDDLTIEFIEFAPAAEEEEVGTLSTLTYTVEGLMPSLVALLAVILFFFGVARPIVSKITTIPVRDPNLIAKDDEEEKGAPAVSLSADELLERVRHSLNHEMETLDPEDLNALVEKFVDPSSKVLRRWMKKAG